MRISVGLLCDEQTAIAILFLSANAGKILSDESLRRENIVLGILLIWIYSFIIWIHRLLFKDNVKSVSSVYDLRLLKWSMKSKVYSIVVCFPWKLWIILENILLNKISPTVSHVLKSYLFSCVNHCRHCNHSRY